MIDQISEKLDDYQSRKKEKLNYNFLQKNGNEIIDIDDINDLVYIKNKDFRNLMQI